MYNVCARLTCTVQSSVMSASGDEKICNEIIYKLQKLSSLLMRLFNSVEAMVDFLTAHSEGDSDIVISHLSFNSMATFGYNSQLLKDTLSTVDNIFTRIAKTLQDEIDPDLFDDLESSGLTYSNRLHLLSYAEDYDNIKDIVATFVLRFLPDLMPLTSALSNGFLDTLSIIPFISDLNDEVNGATATGTNATGTTASETTASETNASDAIADIIAAKSTDYNKLLKEVDHIVITCVPDVTQYISYTSQTLLIVEDMLL